jgi:hypothetical protein
MAHLTDDAIIFNNGRSVPIPGAGGFIGINADLWIGGGHDMTLISPDRDPSPGDSPIFNEGNLTNEEIIELAECMIKYWGTLAEEVKAHGENYLKLRV